MKLTIGADPELFIKDNKTGKLISADGLFPGTKDNPHPVMHGAIQVDGMAAEYNVLPASYETEFILNHISVLRSLRDSIKENNPGLDFDFVFSPVAEFGAEYIAQQSEVARALGCTPDYNAYENGQPNPTPDAEMPFRTASGHIHLGWTKDQDINDPEHLEACCMLVKQLDCTVGLNMLELEGDVGHKRRELYGKAGAFRPKPYGVEYRTPSNVWLRNTYLIRRMFSYAQSGFKQLLDGQQLYNQNPWKNNVPRYINNHDVKNKAYYIGGSWEIPNYREKSEPVSMKTLDKLFLQYAPYDTTEQITPEMLAEIKAAMPVVPRAKRKADRIGDVQFFENMDEIPPLGFDQVLDFDQGRQMFVVRNAPQPVVAVDWEAVDDDHFAVIDDEDVA